MVDDPVDHNRRRLFGGGRRRKVTTDSTPPAASEPDGIDRLLTVPVTRRTAAAGGAVVAAAAPVMAPAAVGQAVTTTITGAARGDLASMAAAGVKKMLGGIPDIGKWVEALDALDTGYFMSGNAKPTAMIRHLLKGLDPETSIDDAKIIVRQLLDGADSLPEALRERIAEMSLEPLNLEEMLGKELSGKKNIGELRDQLTRDLKDEITKLLQDPEADVHYLEGLAESLDGDKDIGELANALKEKIKTVQAEHQEALSTQDSKDKEKQNRLEPHSHNNYILFAEKSSKEGYGAYSLKPKHDETPPLTHGMIEKLVDHITLDMPEPTLAHAAEAFDRLSVSPKERRRAPPEDAHKGHFSSRFLGAELKVYKSVGAMSFETNDPTVIRTLNGLLKGKPTGEIGLPVAIYEAAEKAKGKPLESPPTTIHPNHRLIEGSGVAPAPAGKAVTT